MTIAPYNISRPQIKPDWSLPASDPAVFVFASWSRVLAEAKPENKLGIFGFIAEDAVTYLHVHRQRVVDDLLLVAGETGLVGSAPLTYRPPSPVHSIGARYERRRKRRRRLQDI